MSKYIGSSAVNLSTTSADVTGNADIDGNLTVGGNLTVSGTTITVDHATAQTVDLGDGDKIRLGADYELQLWSDGTTGQISGDINHTGSITTGGLTVSQDGGTTVTFGEHGTGDTTELFIKKGYDAESAIWFQSSSARYGGLVMPDNEDIIISLDEGSILTGDRSFLVQSSGRTKTHFSVEETGDISFYDTSGNAKFFWDASDERLVLGTTENNPVASLAIKTDINGRAIHIEENSGGESYQIGVDADGGLGFYNSGLTTASVTFDDSGNLLVGRTDTGVSTTTAGMELNSSGYISASRSLGNDTGSIAYLNRLSSTAGDLIQLRIDGVTRGKVGITGTDNMYTASADGLGLKFNADASRIDMCNASGASLDASADIGGDTSRIRRLYLSDGIYLGGTGSANKLDDYEEGTFTPTVYAHNGSMTATYVTANTYGRYTKTGQLVSFDLEVRTSTISGANNGFLRIGGLPFTSPSNFHQPVFALSIYRVTFNTSSIYTVEFTGVLSNSLYIRESRSNNTSAEMPSSAWSAANPTLIRVSGSYRTS